MTAVGAILVFFALRISCLNVCEGTGEDTVLTVNGTIVNTAENEETFMLICTTNKKPLQCSIEFLHNNSTIESLRNSYDGCYDKYGKCQPVICSCSDDCLSFQWNFTTSSVKVNDSLGCHIRIYNSTYKSSYKVFALVVYNGTDFTSVTSIKQTIAKTSHSPSKKKETLGHLAAVLITVVFISLVVIFICRVYVYHRKQNGKKTNSSLLNDKNYGNSLG